MPSVLVYLEATEFCFERIGKENAISNAFPALTI